MTPAMATGRSRVGDDQHVAASASRTWPSSVFSRLAGARGAHADLRARRARAWSNACIGWPSSSST